MTAAGARKNRDVFVWRFFGLVHTGSNDMLFERIEASGIGV